MTYLTKLPGVPDSDEVKPGMASFAGEGPIGAKCGNCRFRSYWREMGKPKFNTRTQKLEVKRYRTMACKKYLELAMRHGPAVKEDWPACKYWEAK